MRNRPGLVRFGCPCLADLMVSPGPSLEHLAGQRSHRCAGRDFFQQSCPGYLRRGIRSVAVRGAASRPNASLAFRRSDAGWARPSRNNPGSIINPGGRRAGMAGDPLRDLDCPARIHVFSDARRTEAVTTNSFQDPACLRPFLDQLQDTRTIRASLFNRSRFLPKEGKSGALGFDAR
jgi:hypothetical protein